MELFVEVSMQRVEICTINIAICHHYSCYKAPARDNLSKFLNFSNKNINFSNILKQTLTTKFVHLQFVMTTARMFSNQLCWKQEKCRNIIENK